MGERTKTAAELEELEAVRLKNLERKRLAMMSGNDALMSKRHSKKTAEANEIQSSQSCCLEQCPSMLSLRRLMAQIGRILWIDIPCR